VTFIGAVVDDAFDWKWGRSRASVEVEFGLPSGTNRLGKRLFQIEYWNTGVGLVAFRFLADRLIQIVAKVDAVGPRQQLSHPAFEVFKSVPAQLSDVLSTLASNSVPFVVGPPSDDGWDFVVFDLAAELGAVEILTVDRKVTQLTISPPMAISRELGA
jgi:hypothetical protein